MANLERLGPYEVHAPLGAGGMGEVFRATDSHLGREVALKLLPEGFADDPERHARFEREAKLLASLNHPNIATLYGLEHLDGQHVLVMELVEGEDLSERIRRGAISLEEAAPLAVQIARALEAAHEQGIVHRDLKPANVKLRPDGTVKVLDFGLAKAWEADGSESDLSMSPTLTAHATAAGVILGTAAYMAPEQAAGQPADRRADVWAFGVVLWEMLTGRKLFDGETVSHVLASVLKDEIDLDALPADTPARIRELIDRCLRKKPGQRLQAIGDARVLLEEYVAAPERFAAAAGFGKAPTAVTARWLRLLPWATTVALAAALIALVVVRTPAPKVPMRFQILAPENLTEVGPPTISPDGRTIAFDATDDKGATQIWVRAMDDLEARPVPGTEGSTRPFWSPDSRYLGFVAGGKLKKVPLSGGPPQTLADTPTGSDGTWSSRGVILFDGRASDPIKRVAATGGTPQDLVAPDPEAGTTITAWPEFLPDGRHFLYTVDGVKAGERFLMVGDVEGEEPAHKLLEVTSLVRFAAPDHLLFVRDDTLLAQPFDPASAEVKGEAVPLAEQLGSNGVGLSDFSASDDGTLVYRSGWTAQRRLVWVDRTGHEIGDAAAPAVYRDSALSPDGKLLAVGIEDARSDNRDIWLVDLARGVSSRFTFDAARDSSPVFSPDGKTIVFGSNRGGGSYDLYAKDAAGGGAAQELLKTEISVTPCDWSRDGHWLAFHGPSKDTGWDVWVLAMDGPEQGKAIPFVQGQFTEALPRFSPDGRWIVYMSNESGQFEVYVKPFPGPGGKWQVSTDGGREPQWSADGKEIVYVAEGGTLVSVPVTTGTTFTASKPHELFPVRLQPITIRNRWLVAPDGQRFLLLEPEGTSRSLPMTVVLNWAATLAAR